LLSEGDFEVIALSDQVNDALEELATISPDLVILNYDADVKMHEKIKAKYPRQKLSFIVFPNDTDNNPQIFSFGATGYLSVFDEVPEFIADVKTICRGEVRVSRALANVLLQTMNKEREKASNRSSDLEDLTQRELQVLRLVAEGYTNKEIGQKLFISHNTVKYVVSRLIAKLGARSRADVARRGYGIIRRAIIEEKLKRY